ncbi:hypothetical protein SteCoe_24725 [Stentor coeruleus]|uniref:RING-CH-type domain-containing protein n=1 Tax=Stentor coeruleus TaxID=5963 RepID=A0A1R2BGY4_9CILI|nr:hypothetical protein SteCoe_24725 [Stentor coeruleus]
MEQNLDVSPRLKPAQLAENICRICFDIESDSHHLITPCKCSGSMKYVHEECLKIWLLSRDKDLSTSECDICKTQFEMKINLALKCTCKNYWNECLGIIIFPILITLMSSILVVILLFLVQGIQNNKSSASEQAYLILLLIVCAIITILIIFIFIKTIKRGCCTSEIISWNIQSVTFNDVIEETLENIDNNEPEQRPDVNIMVLPKFSRLNGMNIVIPDIQSPRLIPILRDGQIIGYRSRSITNRSITNRSITNRSLTGSQNLNISSGSRNVVVPSNAVSQIVPDYASNK